MSFSFLFATVLNTTSCFTQQPSGASCSRVPPSTRGTSWVVFVIFKKPQVTNLGDNSLSESPLYFQPIRNTNEGKIRLFHYSGITMVNNMKSILFSAPGSLRMLSLFRRLLAYLYEIINNQDTKPEFWFILVGQAISLAEVNSRPA